MNKYIVSLHVQVMVEAMNETQAEQKAFDAGDQLLRQPGAHITAATLVRKVDR